MDAFLGFSDLESFLLKNKDAKTAITFHSIGDRDAVASAISLSQIFSDSRVIMPDFITNNAKHMLEHSGHGGRIGTALPGGIELVVVVDANRLELLGNLEQELFDFDGDILFIDHHSLPSNTGYGGRIFIFNDEQYNSASSIVYEVLKRNSVKIQKPIAYMLINGIVADSAEFQNSNPLVFKQISELLEISDLRYSEVVETSHGPAAPELRNKILRDVFGASTEVCGKYLLAYGSADFQANTAAETALRIGADASVFWSLHEKEVSFAGRLKSPLDKELGLHLGKIMEDAGKIIEGTGGGHPCAAGAYGKKTGAAAAARDQILKSVRERLRAGTE